MNQESDIAQERDVVTAHTTFVLRVEDRKPPARRHPAAGVDVQVTLSYLTSDPHAVHLSFSNGVSDDVDWVFSRLLLADGLHRQTGQGDVRIAPLPGSRNTTILVELNAPSGRALCEAPVRVIAAFLAQSERLVPIGAEPQVNGLDAELAALLTTEGA